MFRRRRVLLALGLTVMLAGAGIAAGMLLYRPLPRPEAADAEQLLRWLVTRDLSQEPSEIRHALVRRLEEEFSSGIDWEATGSRLDLAQKTQVWNNIVVLMEPWFLDKVDHYQKLSDADRPTYVDRLLDTLGMLRGVDLFRDTPGVAADATKKDPGLMEIFFARIEQWKRQAEPQRRKQIGQFLAAIQTRQFMRSLGFPPATG